MSMTAHSLTPLFRRLVVSVACVLALATAAFAADKKPFDIPAGTAEEALKQFMAQSGTDVVYPAEILRGVQTPALKGQMTPDEAIQQLLAGTPVAAKLDEKGNTFMLSRDPNVSRAVVQTDARPSRSGKTELDANGEPVVKLDTFEVFGQKTLNMDIPRTRDDIQPYVVFDRQSINDSGATTIDEFLRTRLSMNTVQRSGAQAPIGTNAGGNSSSVNLRGLGANQTLILVDGRRLPNVNVSGFSAGDPNQADINGIPVSAIERIEILPSTASGIYGGGATGGVINIITSRKYSGADVSVTYRNTMRHDLDSRQANVAAGLTLNSGRTRIFFSASRSDSSKLTLNERDFTRRARALLVANVPGFLSNLTFPPLGYLPNIRNSVAANLVLKTGGTLNSRYTYVPAGYGGASTDSGAALVANAGQYSFLDLPNDVMGNQSLLTAPTITAGSFDLHQDLVRNVEVYGSMLWNRTVNHNSPNTGGYGGSVILPASAPNNPFTTAVQLASALPSFPYSEISQQTDTLRIACGLIVRLPKEWSLVMDYAWSKTRWEIITGNPVGDPDGSGPATDAVTAIGNGTLNVLRDVNAYPIDFSPFKLALPNQHLGPQDMTLNDFSLRASGPVFQLPTGPVILSGLADRSMQSAKPYYQDFRNVTDGTQSFTYVPPSRTTTNSYYVETTVPLIGPQMARPFLQDLSFQASVRRDEFATFLSTPNSETVASRTSPVPPVSIIENRMVAEKFTVGFRYAPSKDFALRASYGTGFLPPTASQLYPSTPFPPSGPLVVIDPLRGNISQSYAVTSLTSGGNPALLPEESHSISAGVIITPHWVPSLRLSVDYTEIQKHNEIRNISFQDLVYNEAYFPGRITRAPLTPADAAAGYTAGVITAMDDITVNVAKTKVRAVDIQGDYEYSFRTAGRLHVYAVVTYEGAFKRQATPSAPVISLVGYSDGPLKWRGNCGISWDRGNWTAGWNMQYYDSYLIYSSTATPASIAVAVLNQGSALIHSQIYHDLFVRYRFPARMTALGGLLANSEVKLGVQNIFDREPPILATTSLVGVLAYSNYGDPRLSRYELSFGKKF